jgi:LysM repeat protein
MRNILSLCLFLFIVSTAFAQKKQSSAVSYIEKYKILAISEMQKTGIPASITLAQALHESANGTSQVAVKANNHFGVKCTRNWSGKRFHRNGNKRNSCFRKYDSVKDAYADRSSFLSKNKQYAFLFKYKPTQYKKWAYGLQRSGYARSKTYASHLLKTINTYNLHKYDYARLDTTNRNDSLIVNIVYNKVDEVEEKEEVISNNKTATATIKHKVKSGQSLYYISRKYKVSVEKIKKANKLKSNKIKPGKVLIIPKK